MVILFASRKLEKTFNAQKAMVAEFGRDRANRIALRMAVLGNAPCLGDVPSVPPERCHLLANDLKGKFAVDVGANWRLVFEPADDPVPKLEDGGFDLKAISSIRVLEVVDYHGR